MPFGDKPGPGGVEINFDEVYGELLAPAVEAAGLHPHRADADRRGGSIHADMFQDLLLAEFVVADLTLDNANVWYELGVRHALRKSGTVLTYAVRDRLPFDIAGQRMQRYTLKDGRLDPDKLPSERDSIAEAIRATLADWHERRVSPVYAQLPNLTEPDWKTLKVGDVNEFWEALDEWREWVEIARQKNFPGDIMLLAQETPNHLLELDALRTAADALVKLNRPFYALSVLEQARKLDPNDVKCQQLEGPMRSSAGPLRGRGKPFALKTGLELRVCKPHAPGIIEVRELAMTTSRAPSRNESSILMSSATRTGLCQGSTTTMVPRSTAK